MIEPKVLDENRMEQRQVRKINHMNSLAAVMSEYKDPPKVFSQMPDSTKEEILQSNLANLKLQKKHSHLTNISQTEIKSKALNLIKQASSVSMSSAQTF